MSKPSNLCLTPDWLTPDAQTMELQETVGSQETNRSQEPDESQETKSSQSREETIFPSNLTLRVFALAFVAQLIPGVKDAHAQPPAHAQPYAQSQTHTQFQTQPYAQPQTHTQSQTQPPAQTDTQTQTQTQTQTPAQPPEIKFLRSQYALLNSIGEKWQTILTKYLSEPAPEDEALISLARRLTLSLIELLSVALALGVEEDSFAGRSIAYVQSPIGGSRPTLGLLDAAYGQLSMETGEAGSKAMIRRNWIAGAIAAGRAVQTGVLSLMNESAPLPEQTIKVPTALALALRGHRFSWPGAMLGLQQEAIGLPPSVLNMARRHAETLTKIPHGALVLRTTSEREARAVADVMAGMLHKEAIFTDSEQKNVAGLGPLCLAGNLVPVISCDLAPGEHRVLPEIPGYNGPILILARPDGTVESSVGSTLDWTIPIPKRDERYLLWRSTITDADLAAELAKEHLHSAGRIAELSRLSVREARFNHRLQPNRDDIREASWMSEGGGLGSLALPVKDRVPDKALVLHASTRQELFLLEQRCRERETLSDNLGITMKARYQLGVKALFVGPSGTGKTLAAGWLATRLNLPLYRVDLSSVTSKYIGETEKNLAMLLAHAEKDEVVLLFDEADSLFGKRTEIKDANDRYANSQTNYLLQRIETYNGIVLLTSNSRARFDSAFTRRIDMIVDFPIPGPEERRDLWQSHLGANHRLSAKHMNQLAATCDLCGGHIRNVVLTAAVLAQSESRSVSLSDIVQGLIGEYRKLGRQIPIDLKCAVRSNSVGSNSVGSNSVGSNSVGSNSVGSNSE